MNALAEKYGDKVVILGFPCNQFGHQTNEGPDEFMNTLKYVRPGNGFELSPEVKIMGKTDVNGEAHTALPRQSLVRLLCSACHAAPHHSALPHAM